MSKSIFSKNFTRIGTTFGCCVILALLVTSCDPTNQVDPVNNYKVEIVSSAEGDIPTGAPVEVVLGFKEFTAKVQQLSFDFPSGQVAVTVGEASAAPGQRVPVVLEGTSLAKFKVTGLKAGTHKITVRAENGDATASCVVSLSISDRVYRVELLEEPDLRLTVGWHDGLKVKVVDEQDKNHLFYQTPGYTISARSIDNAYSIIELGITEVWNNVPDSVAVEDKIPLNWASNEGIMMYRAMSVGTHKVEVTVAAPDGATSRTVLTLPVDSSKVVLTPRQTPKTTVKVNETHDATFNVDYLGHPKNRVALMWERLPIGDPYYTAPDVTIGFARPKAGEWTEFGYTRVIGATSYPLPPSKAGSKQGFRLRVKDMYGWEQSFEYRFEVTSSEFAVSLVNSNTPYVQNILNSASLRIENYPANWQCRYKLVPAEPGYLSPVFNERQYDTWYPVDLGGSKGEPYEIPLHFAYGDLYWAPAAFTVVVEDKFGGERTAQFLQTFVRNEVDLTIERGYLTATVGSPVTWSSTLNAQQSDQHTYNNVKWTSPGFNAQKGALKVNNVLFQSSAAGVPAQAIVSGKVVSMSYTPTTAGVHEITLVPVSWCNDGSSTKVVRINALPSGGNFTVTPDQTTYEIPYAEARVYQDINVTLASANESAGLYDWDDTYKIGTSVYYSSNNAGRLVALDASGQEVAIAVQTTVPLKYAVGNTLRLRHYPAQVNNGSIERITLTVTRCDGATATSTVTVDAEDKGFELVENQADWSNPFRKVGERHTIPVKVVNRSKYYRGSYTLKSYVITNGATLFQAEDLGPAKNIPLNGSMGVCVYFLATAAGSTSIRELVIQDDFGRGVTHRHDGFSFIVAD